MEKVSVSELKANLSKYLARVSKGGEICVYDRDRAVARLVGLPVRRPTRAEDDERLARLERLGAVTRGAGDAAEFFDESAPLVWPDGESLSSLIIEERRESR